MPPLRLHETRIVKPALAVVSVLAALAIAWPTYRWHQKRNRKPRPAPYGLQMVDDSDRPLGAVHGPVKIVLDPFVVYRLAPNQQTPRVTTNAFGGRGVLDNDDRPAVAFLGGSACFGQELASDDDTFTSQLQRLDPSRRWMNFGCPGYYSGQELSFYLHRLRKSAPAVVVSVGGWNDCFGAVQGAPRRLGMEGFGDVFFEVRDRLADFHANGKSASLPPPDTSRDEAFERNCKAYIGNMLDLHRIARARGADFLWVVQPELGSKRNLTKHEREALGVWRRHYGYSTEEFTRRYEEMRKRAKEVASENRIAFLDVNE